jgi:DNA-binding LacI/PurR family transcriptional regulator
MGLCRALAEIGLRVPDDVSVVGYDDIPMLEYLPVPLTTVRVPTFRMGQTAAQMLMQHIESKQTVPPQKVYLEAELIVRASTRALSDAAEVPALRAARAARPAAAGKTVRAETRR